jgi:hypothetical protein
MRGSATLGEGREVVVSKAEAMLIYLSKSWGN